MVSGPDVRIRCVELHLGEQDCHLFQDLVPLLQACQGSAHVQVPRREDQDLGVCICAYQFRLGL